MKTYRARFNTNLKGVYGISLVDEPAMEGDFLAFDKQEEIKLAKVDEEKRILMGLVLEPNKLVFRKGQEGQEDYQVFFSEQDIEDVAYNFQKQSAQTNSTIQHSGERIEGVTFVEQWIIEDSLIDKSAKFGFNYPKGSWMAMMKVDNDQIWNDYVKTGKVKGFSIDALMKFEEVNLNKQINMDSKDNKTLLDHILDLPAKIALALNPKEVEVEVKLGMEKLEDGSLTINFEGEELVEGSSVWITSEESEEKAPLPVGEYILEGGKVLVVSEDGVAASVTAKEVEKEVEVEAEVKTEFTKETLDTFEVALTKTITDIVGDLRKENEALKVSLSKIEEQVVELGKEPASKPIKSAPEQVEFSKMTPYQQLKFNEENNLR